MCCLRRKIDMKNKELSRRNFLKQLTLGTAGAMFALNNSSASENEREIRVKLEEIIGSSIEGAKITPLKEGTSKPMYIIENVPRIKSSDVHISALHTEKGTFIFIDALKEKYGEIWDISKGYIEPKDAKELAYQELIKKEFSEISTSRKNFVKQTADPRNLGGLIRYTINHEAQHDIDLQDGQIHRCTAYLSGELGEQRVKETGFPINENVLMEERAYLGNILHLPRKHYALSNILGANSVDEKDDFKTKEATTILLNVFNRALDTRKIAPLVYAALSREEIQDEAIKWAEKYHPDMLE
jgi:hypothetical protein